MRHVVFFYLKTHPRHNMAICGLKNKILKRDIGFKKKRHSLAVIEHLKSPFVPIVHDFFPSHEFLM